MPQRLAINGFGRIGRLAARIWFANHKEEAVLSAINTSGSMDLEGWAHLLKYDSAYGPFPGVVEFRTHQSKDKVSDSDPLLGHLIIDSDYEIPVLAQRDPGKIPWATYSTDLVIEATGVFRTEALASTHLHPQGAKQVLLSAPAKSGSVETVLLGVTTDHPQKNVYSVESCTTNCTAPVISVINENFGISKAFLSTIHAFTDDQNLQDGSHKDLRRARAASFNIVPTSTGAATATTRVIPELKNKFDGLAFRVPILTGSLIDATIITKREVTKEEVNSAFEKASTLPKYKGILSVTNDPIVSSDTKGRSESALVDLSLTTVVDGDLLKVYAWYDNEWGFTHRLVEAAIALSSKR